MSSLPDPLLYDAVTLRHFSVCGRLDICQRLHAHLPTPRWVAEVEREVRGANTGYPECSAILSAGWLGPPMSPTTTAEHQAIRRLQVRINGGSTGDAGEAESIYFASVFGGRFATDDNTAFAFAQGELGVGRVVDTVDILHDAVDAGILTRDNAAAITVAIRSAQRYLRRVHPDPMTAADF